MSQGPPQAQQQLQPAALLLQIPRHRQRCGVGWGQARLFRQHQPQQQSIDRPTEAVAGIAVAIAAIQPPAKAGPLQQSRDRASFIGLDAMARQQRRAGQQVFEAGGGKPFSRQFQQGQQALYDPRLALLAAVGEPPGQVYARGFAVAKHRRHQGREQVHFWRHHQHISRRQAGVGGQQLQDLIPHDLHLPQPTGAGQEHQ